MMPGASPVRFEEWERALVSAVTQADRLTKLLLSLPEHERHASGCPDRQQAYWRMRSEYRPSGHVDQPCNCGAPVTQGGAAPSVVTFGDLCFAGMVRPRIVEPRVSVEDGVVLGEWSLVVTDATFDPGAFDGDIHASVVQPLTFYWRGYRCSGSAFVTRVGFVPSFSRGWIDLIGTGPLNQEQVK